MSWWRYILFPFGLLYGGFMWMRRTFYLLGWKKRYPGKINSLVIGNLQVGGGGKTPMAIYLSQKLSEKRNVAVLSRGYGRKTKGFFEVSKANMSIEVGDEPLEMRSALPGNIRNFVCENRVQGIQQIQNVYPECNLVVLDDAFQHLSLKASFYLLLTEYDRLFTSDFPMPCGHLREFPSAAKDAGAIIVTKCPPDLNAEQGLGIYGKLAGYGRPIYFASYENAVPINGNGQLLDQRAVIVVSALANNKRFTKWASNNYHVKATFTYGDHFNFGKEEVEKWNSTMAETGAEAILTSRKDLMRMKDFKGLEGKVYFTFTEPKFLFDAEEEIIQLILRQIC